MFILNSMLKKGKHFKEVLQYNQYKSIKQNTHRGKNWDIGIRTVYIYIYIYIYYIHYTLYNKIYTEAKL